jgi:hypothetical protein
MQMKYVYITQFLKIELDHLQNLGYLVMRTQSRRIDEMSCLITLPSRLECVLKSSLKY